MAELTIQIREYIGDSSYNWLTDEFEWASNCDDLRWAVEAAGYRGETVDSICLEIGNCYGGSVYEGLEMFHYLQGLNVPIRTRILGTVASMGTVLPLCGDIIEVAQTAQFMVHAPSNEMWGTAAEIGASLKGLQNDTAAIAAVYVARTGQDAATVAGWLTQDTWLTADEALALGLCTAVLPLRPKTAPPAPTEAVAQLRRKRFAEAVARADKRAAPTTAKPAAAAAPTAMPDVKKPIKQAAAPAAAKPKPRAAAPAAKPAAKTAQPQARKTLFQQLKELFDGASEEEVEEAETTAMADVQTTDLENGAKLYHEGELVVNTTAVFNDEALTEATADGDYDTADGQVLTVAGGICTALGPDPEATAAETPAVAQLRTDHASLQAKFDKLTAEFDKLKATTKPPMPQARGKVRTDAPDPKAKVRPTQPEEGAGTL